MWREIKKIISSNNSNHTFPTAITVINETITNPFDILLMPSITILLKLL